MSEPRAGSEADALRLRGGEGTRRVRSERRDRRARSKARLPRRPRLHVRSESLPRALGAAALRVRDAGVAERSDARSVRRCAAVDGGRADDDHRAAAAGSDGTAAGGPREPTRRRPLRRGSSARGGAALRRRLTHLGPTDRPGDRLPRAVQRRRRTPPCDRRAPQSLRPDPPRVGADSRCLRLYHKVDIKVRTRKDLVVRARKGYYAPKG